MQTNIRFPSLLIALGAVSAAWVTPFAAPLAAEKAKATLEEIVVTARRREETLQDIPVAVTVFTGEEW